MLVGSLLAGGIVFASTSLVQAQKEIVNYGGIQGTGLVYGGTTYAELYAVQQVLKQQGVVNHWTGSAFTMDSASKSNTELASQNQQLTQQLDNLNGIVKNLTKLPATQQQQILNKLSQEATSSQGSSAALQTLAQGLQQAVNNTAGSSGIANEVLQNLLSGKTGSGLVGTKGASSAGSSASSGAHGSSGSSTASNNTASGSSTNTTTTTSTTTSLTSGNSTTSNTTP